MTADDNVLVGPMQLLAVGFETGVDVEAGLLEAVDQLQGRGVLRLLDLLVTRRNEDGSVTRILLEDDEFGELLGGVVSTGPEDLFDLLAGNDPADAGKSPSGALAERLAPGAIVAFLLIEHRWARPLFDAIAEAGGLVLGDRFIADEAQAPLQTEVAAFEEAADGVAVAQALEAGAAREAMAAVGAAEETIAAADDLRSVAARDAVNALVDAGLIQDAAIEEAVEAITLANQQVDAAQQELKTAQRRVDSAEQQVAEVQTAASMTAGEIRVLRYLPTGMTFAVIADKLGISRSAAKERAERAYKKLGVHNRDDAVERARGLRLIPKSS